MAGVAAASFNDLAPWWEEDYLRIISLVIWDYPGFETLGFC